jgi:probable HAF family extracellular repeat protein
MVQGLLLTPPVSAQPPQYTVVELHVGNTFSSQAEDINASGQVVGSALISGHGPRRPVLWADDRLTDINGLNGNGNVAYGINDNAQIAGYSVYISNARAFLWQDGVVTNLAEQAPPYVIPQSQGHGINASGHVVGQISYVLTPGLRTMRAALWRDGVMTELPAFGDATCPTCSKSDTARAINASGQIVGTAGARASLWQDGTVADLGTLGGNSSAAFGINDSGHIVGQAQLPFAAPTYGSTRAFLWKNGAMTSLGTLGDSRRRGKPQHRPSLAGWQTAPTVLGSDAR